MEFECVLDFLTLFLIPGRGVRAGWRVREEKQVELLARLQDRAALIMAQRDWARRRGRGRRGRGGQNNGNNRDMKQKRHTFIYSYLRLNNNRIFICFQERTKRSLYLKKI